MKTFTVVDLNDPEKIFIDCVGATIEHKKAGQVIIFTANGRSFEVGPQMLYPLAILLQRKIAEAAKVEGTITIPDLSEVKNDDELRMAIEGLTIE